jgi:hypothetical protein
MRVLIVPLNWGLGHATRCIPLIERYLEDGDQVAIGGTGDSLRLLQQYFPMLETYQFAPLELTYSSGSRQVVAMMKALPELWRFARMNRQILEQITTKDHFDLIISDNCFGVWTDHCDCVYITHQLHIMFPRPWRWLEPLAERLHARLYANYKEIWVPDFEGYPNLSGELGHPKHCDSRVKYIGPLSRFVRPEATACEESSYDTVVIVSGLEPHRTMFETELRKRLEQSAQKYIIYSGLNRIPPSVLVSAKHIIARSGYSTIMDLYALGLLDKAELHPTPGQPEQQYLANYLNNSYLISAPITL